MKEVTQCSEMITSDSKPTHSFIFIIKHPHFFSLPPDSEVTLLGLISDILGISSWLSFDSVVPDILLTLSAQRPTCSWKPWQNSLLQLIKSLFFFFSFRNVWFYSSSLRLCFFTKYYHMRGSVKLAVITHDSWYTWVICIYE